MKELEELPAGSADAQQYQRLILKLFNLLFEPELVNGEPQVRTATGTEIRDVVFENNSDLPFFRYLLTEYSAFLVVFECKNSVQLDSDDVNQLANYLGDPIGRCGFIVTRNAPRLADLKKARATYNKLSPRRAVVMLSDDDLRQMIALRRAGSRHPVAQLQRRYRELIQSIE
ncbi:MAG: hypothetical protein M3451_07555 [Chloroflexota bacterium]|nr:hypothetical protein [Chloroflexota bacterium]